MHKPKFSSSILLIATFVLLFNGITLAQKPVEVMSLEEFQPVLQQDNDTVYIVNFWATWCKPCVAEMPYFEQLHAKYKDQKVRVILVSLDVYRQLDTKLIPFVEKNKIQSRVLMLNEKDPNKYIDKIEPSWSGAIPATIFYKGKKREFVEDHFEDLASLESIVLKLTKS
jgi:thiol-disulfide isomerase/thioredoxin